VIYFLSIVRDPLIVNPREHISEDDIDHIQASFEHIRGENKCDGPPMFIVAPYDRAGIDDVEELSKKSKTNTTLRWAPNNDSPEWVVVKRASALAKKSFDFLTNCLRNFNDDGWSTTFHETSNAFHAYSILLRIDEDFHFDPLSSSSGADLGIDGETGDFKETAFSRSTRARFLGPKKLRRKIYRNLRGTSEAEMLLEWNPIQSMVASLQEKLGRHALFFYNELAPEVVCILWRPQLFEPTALSIMSSDYMSPVGDGMWKADSLVKRNSSDLIREMKQVYSDFVTAVKVIEKTNGEYRGQKRKLEEDN
jgi:U3 small nucleolar RNA-associated protein 22